MIKIDVHNHDRFNISAVLQKGILIRLSDPFADTVSGFICGLFSISPETMENNIKTIMQNNKIVDSPEKAKLSPGDTLVLSGAMPGLVGAMLRSGSPLKAMRANITSIGGNSEIPRDEFFLRVKLFNTVMKKYRQNVINRGFYVTEAE